MTQTSRVWGGTATGDASSAPYDAENEFSDILKSVGGAAGNSNSRSGVFMHELNNLLPTGSISPINIADGRALVYGTWYQSDADETVVIPTPLGATRNDIIVLRKDWAAKTVRITRIAGTEGGGVPTGSLVQTSGLYWDFPIAYVAITTAGAITITDRRSFIGTDQTKPFVVVSASAVQPIESGIETTVSFDEVDYESAEDADMYLDTHPTRLTAPFPGIYRIHGNVSWEPNATGYRVCRLRLNGSDYITENYRPISASAATSFDQDIIWEGALDRGDYVEIRVIHLAGVQIDILQAAPNRTPRFSMEWIRSRY